MTATLVIFALLLGVLAWLILGGRSTPSGLTPGRRPGVDRAELEAAERDVQDAASEDEVRD